MATLLYVVGAIIIAACFIMPFEAGAGLSGVISTLFTSGPAVLILFGIARIIDHVDALESFVYEAYEKENMKSLLNKVDSKANKGWKCSACGRENASYVGTCGCGKKRDEK